MQALSGGRRRLVGVRRASRRAEPRFGWPGTPGRTVPTIRSAGWSGSRTGTHGDPDVWNYFTVGYSAATGAQMWKATYNGPQNRGDTAEGIGVSPDGSRVFVTGTSASSRVFVTGSGGDDYITVAFDTATIGPPLWAARYDGGHGIDRAYGVAVNPEGTRVYVTGESEEGRIACFGDIRSTA